MQNHEHAVKYLEKFGAGKISQWLGTITALVEEELTSQHLHSSLQSPVTPVSGAPMPSDRRGLLDLYMWFPGG